MKERIFLAGIIITAFALMCYGSITSYVAGFDTGTVELMAVKISQGEFPLFYYGQNYLGPIEAYVAAVFVSLFGFSGFVVTLGPILFSLAWVVATWLLFSMLFDRSTANVAALCVAFPGYYVFYFQINPYACYPALFFLGTLCLYLSTRVMVKKPEGRVFFLHYFVIGIAAGTAVWVHALVYPYLILSFLILFVHLACTRKKLQSFAGMFMAAGITLAGFLPLVIARQNDVSSSVNSLNFSLSYLTFAFKSLCLRNIKDLVIWNFDAGYSQVSFYANLHIVVYLLLVCLSLIALVCVLVDCCKNFKTQKTWYRLIPLVLVAVYLACYLPHSMAFLHAPRYAVGLWLMILCYVWSVVFFCSRGKIRIAVMVLLTAWIAYQVIGSLLFANMSAPGKEKEERNVTKIVELADDAGLTSVVLLGSPNFGFKGQSLSALSENRIKFYFANSERYHKNAQFGEDDPHTGILCMAGDVKKIGNSLKLLQVSYDINVIGPYRLLINLDLQENIRRKAIVSTGISFPAGSSFPISELNRLVDLDQNTSIALTKSGGQNLVFDLGQVEELCGLWLFSSINGGSGLGHPLPPGHSLSVSVDGYTFEEVYPANIRYPNSYISGNHLYMGDYWPRIGVRFSPVAARYVKLVFAGGWNSRLSEVIFFRSYSEPQAEVKDDVNSILELIKKHNLRFVLADRWLSSSIIKQDGSNLHRALGRHNPKEKNHAFERILFPDQDVAVACEKEVADICGRILDGMSERPAVQERIDLGRYSIFLLAGDEKEPVQNREVITLWNGHLLLNSSDPQARLLGSQKAGLPFFAHRLNNSKGMYRDDWTDGAGSFVELDYDLSGSETILVVHTRGWSPFKDDLIRLNLQVRINDSSPLDFLKKEGNNYIFKLPEELHTVHSIHFSSAVFSPPTADRRTLGINVEYAELK